MTSNGSATTLQKAVLNPRDEWRSPWSSASERWKRSRTSDALVEGTREIAFPPLPFIAIYEVFETQGEVRVLRILHGAQQWPPR